MVSRHNLLRGEVSSVVAALGLTYPGDASLVAFGHPSNQFQISNPSNSNSSWHTCHIASDDHGAACSSDQSMTPRIIMFIPGDIMSMFGQLSITPCLCTFCMITVT